MLRSGIDEPTARDSLSENSCKYTLQANILKRWRVRGEAVQWQCCNVFLPRQPLPLPFSSLTVHFARLQPKGYTTQFEDARGFFRVVPETSGHRTAAVIHARTVHELQPLLIALCYLPRAPPQST